MNTRVARCHLLAEVLAADGIMTDAERALLEQHLAHDELSDDDRRKVREFDNADDAIPVLRGLPAAERHEIIDQLVEAALADGKLTPNETAAVKRIAAALGVDD
jgi:uncharacterized tellurite resistance protein B-like protein